MASSPFDWSRAEDYARWRAAKLACQPSRLEELVVEIGDPRRLTEAEYNALLACCRRANLAVYVSPIQEDPDKEIVRALGARFGLHRLDHNRGADEDAITALKVQTDARHAGYIPYTNRPIAWHTDGYYNEPAAQIQGLLLHCVRPAASGGENALLDHEMVYLRLRDRHPEYLRALMHPEAMTIPAHRPEGGPLRPAQPGPVFSVHPDGHLHMRYTDRKRNIHWREDPLTQEAVAALREILASPGPPIFQVRLETGWGLIGNNVLHTRTGFAEQGAPRLLYRARYYDRIAGT